MRRSTVRAMVAYMVAHVKVHDTAWLESEYMSVAAALEERYGGVHVASGLHDQVEGDELGPVTSILQFPSLEAAQAFWHDPEYQRVVPLRRAGSESQVLIIEGAEVPAPFAKSPPR